MRFQDTLDKTVDSFERPALLPQGDYVFQVSKSYVERFVGENDRYQILSFPCRPVEPLDSVDPDDLKKFGGDIAKSFMSKEFMLDTEGDDNAGKEFLSNVRRFLEHCGVEPELTLKQALAAVVGAKFIGKCQWQADKNDSELFRARIGRTAPVE